MKRSIIAALALAGACLSACAGLPKGDLGGVIVSPAADSSAVKAEAIIATLATSFEAVVRDPQADIDRPKLARQVIKAHDGLVRARQAFDGRGGGVSGLLGEALGAISDALPAGTSLAARFALSTAFTGLQLYAGSMDAPGEPAPPSEALRRARDRTDDAVAQLLAALPAPES